MKKYSIGVDFGSNSARALIVDVENGDEVATSVYNYSGGELGIYLDSSDPLLARQHPQDYIDGFNKSVRNALVEAAAIPGFSVDHVVGIGITTTGSTPVPVDAEGIPLALLPEFKGNLNAYAWLWKDHTSSPKAVAFTEIARSMNRPYLDNIGGKYSSEWFWAKIWHCLDVDEKVFDSAYTWVELADFVPAWITGNNHPDKIVRGICAAGHKSLFNAEWGGLPDEEFLAALNPKLADLRSRLFTEAFPSSHIAGYISDNIAVSSGLKAGIPVGCGAFDCHHGAVGAGIKPETMIKVMGTSTCDIMMSPLDKDLGVIPGLCGIVPESVMCGSYGLESGQSAVGDLFAWFERHLAPQKYTDAPNAIAALSEDAAKLKAGESGLLSLDWNNGNRTVLVDQKLTGLILGQTLHTSAAEVFRALVEATAFGALTIINRHEEYGVEVKEVINCGGIAEKNPFIMQIYADVTGRPMKVSRSSQTCALGASIFGAIVGGVYQSAEDAQVRMTGIKDTVYMPDPQSVDIYKKLYALYMQLHDAFGGHNKAADLGNVMKELIDIRFSIIGEE